jgi:hypothetical protein
VTSLAESAGAWVGVNGFRLMPTDAMAEFPATAQVRLAAGGHLTSVAYTWRHPADGPQEGLLVVGTSDDSGRLTALWADSWHQQPASMTLVGPPADESGCALEAEYGGGWGWRIAIRASGTDDLALEMENVVPSEHATTEAPAGPYPVMAMRLRRA